MRIVIKEKEITKEQLDAWKRKRMNKAFKVYGQNKIKRGANLDEEFRRLNRIKSSCGYEETIKKLRKKLGFTTLMMKIAAKLSGKRKCSVTTIFAPHLSAEQVSAGIEQLMTVSSMKNYQINLNACPEHYALKPTESGMFEVVETPGNSPLPIRFYVAFGEEEGLKTPRDSDYPYQSAGCAKLSCGTRIGGVRHQFRDTEEGCEARLLVEFPSIVPNRFISAHQMHLACEFSYWLNWIDGNLNAPEKGGTI